MTGGEQALTEQAKYELIENVLNKCYCAGSSHGLCQYCKEWTDYYKGLHEDDGYVDDD